MGNELLDLYNQTVKPSLKDLESQRKMVLLWIWVFIGSLLGSILSLSIYAIHIVFLFILFLPLLVVSFLRIKKCESVYSERYKSEVVEKVINMINPELSYSPNGYISKDEYYSSRIFERRADRYSGDDLITGKIDKTDFRCSEIHSQYKKVTRDSDGKSRTQYYTIFQGMFLHADFNKNIKGETFVIPEDKGILKLFGEKRETSKGELVKLENPEFEELFKVYSSDQIEARYILTPGIMEGLIKLKSRFRNNVGLSFLGSRVYCAITFNRPLFEPRVFSSGVNFRDIEFIAELIGYIDLVIKELNLNLRIWSKE